MPLRLLSWNVAGRADKVGDQLAAIESRAPDVVALQELTARTYAPWCEGLLERDYSIVSAVDLVALPYPPPPYPDGVKQSQIRRKNFNLTASRLPIALLDG